MLIKKKYSKRKNYLVGRKSAQAVICDLHHKTKECNMKLYVLHYKNGKKKKRKVKNRCSAYSFLNHFLHAG